MRESCPLLLAVGPQSLRRIIYKFLNVCPFDYTAVAVSGKVERSSGVTVVTLTDRPKSVRNHCVIEVFGGVLVLSRCFLDFSVGVGAFVIGLSQIYSFFSIHFVYTTVDSRHFFLSKLYFKHGFGWVCVIIDFICMDLHELRGARSENYKLKYSCPQRNSNPRPLDFEATTKSTRLRYLINKNITVVYLYYKSSS